MEQRAPHLNSDTTVIVEEESRSTDPQQRRQPRYHVVLWNDDEHTYPYVIDMLKSLFAIPHEKGLQIARKVDLDGRAICTTTTLEHAELKRDQIHAFGNDPRNPRCQGSMSASIEPANA